jgi:hypothetical protein
MTKSKAAKPNPALEPLGKFLGQWRSQGSHGEMPGTTLRGHTSFEWLEGGAFILIKGHIDHPLFPDGISILGSDDAWMLYFDERGVSRQHEASLEGSVLKWWRNAPGFQQRYSLVLSADGNTITGKGELSTDGQTWQQDLDLTYSREE